MACPSRRCCGWRGRWSGSPSTRWPRPWCSTPTAWAARLSAPRGSRTSVATVRWPRGMAVGGGGAVGNTRLMDREGIDLGALSARREEMASAGRTVVWVAVDGRAVALIGIADAARPTSAAAVAALTESGAEVVMLTGDNHATAQRIAAQLGGQPVIAEG